MTLVERLRDPAFSGRLGTAGHEAADRIEALEAALRPFAERQTTREALTHPEEPIWAKATVERRIEMLGERRRAHDDAILAARQALESKA